MPDLDAGIRFYQQIGLRLERRLFGGTVAEMQGAGSPVYLLVKAAGTAPSAFTAQSRSYTRHWTPVHLDFVVPDLDAALPQALAAGAQLESRDAFGWGDLATLSDPFGNGFCLVQWKNGGYANAE